MTATPITYLDFAFTRDAFTIDGLPERFLADVYARAWPSGQVVIDSVTWEGVICAHQLAGYLTSDAERELEARMLSVYHAERRHGREGEGPVSA